MLTLLVLILCILAGFFLRRRHISEPTEGFLTWLVWIMIFVLGVSIGASRGIVEQLDMFGQQAFVLAAAGTMGSVLAAWGLWKFAGRRRPKR